MEPESNEDLTIEVSSRNLTSAVNTSPENDLDGNVFSSITYDNDDVVTLKEKWNQHSEKIMAHHGNLSCNSSLFKQL